MNCSKIVCFCALGALLCSCQSAWAKPAPEPKAPAVAPAEEPGKAEDGKGPAGKDGEGEPPKEGPGPDDAGTDKPDVDKPSEGKSPKESGDEGKAPEGKAPEGNPGEGPAEPPPPAKPPVVEHTEPKFIGDGEVPKVTVYLAKTLAAVSQCVADHGGLDKPKGELEIQFLVRARGRAEGVEVLSSDGVSTEAGRCVRKHLKNRWVGTPTNDPVGVTFHYRLKRSR